MTTARKTIAKTVELADTGKAASSVEAQAAPDAVTSTTGVEGSAQTSESVTAAVQTVPNPVTPVAGVEEMAQTSELVAAITQAIPVTGPPSEVITYAAKAGEMVATMGHFDLAAILLTVVSILLAIVMLFLAVAAFFGFGYFRGQLAQAAFAAETSARIAAEKIAENRLTELVHQIREMTGNSHNHNDASTVATHNEEPTGGTPAKANTDSEYNDL
jgi:hypothetical protein